MHFAPEQKGDAPHLRLAFLALNYIEGLPTYTYNHRYRGFRQAPPTHPSS